MTKEEETVRSDGMTTEEETVRSDGMTKEEETVRSVGMTIGGVSARSVGLKKQQRGRDLDRGDTMEEAASAGTSGGLVFFHVKTPLQRRLANLPCAVTDDAVEQEAPIVIALFALGIREGDQLLRNPQCI
ncbi:MAG: hypothetical protein P8127_15080 [Acidobacteriota bacterium]